MAKSQDINNTPVVSPEGVKFVVVKNGKFAQCSLDDILTKVNVEQPASISKLDEAQNKAITDINKKLADVMAKYEAAASEMAELKLAIAKLQDTAVEADTEEKTVKATKKSKKSAE
jgi:hypothetical protein